MSNTIQKETLYKVLQVLGTSSEPIGAGALASELRKRGSPVSMATAGRILQNLEENDYAEKISNKGRILSPKGQKYLDKVTFLHNRSLKNSTYGLRKTC
jgi:repressor of nif and glnA expression